jgi:hypothetical protein
MNIDYKESDHNNFIIYLFSNEPKDKSSIKLELPLNDNNKNLYLHIFEQLLMIFVDGLKYLYGKNDKVNINELTDNDFNKMKLYFESINYSVNYEKFESINDYQFKFPNYFKNQEKIDNNTKLKDFYYEIYNENNSVFRISFNNII